LGAKLQVWSSRVGAKLQANISVEWAQVEGPPCYSHEAGNLLIVHMDA